MKNVDSLDLTHVLHLGKAAMKERCKKKLKIDESGDQDINYNKERAKEIKSKERCCTQLMPLNSFWKTI